MEIKINEYKQKEILKEYNSYQETLNFLYEDIKTLTKEQEKLKKQPISPLLRYKIIELDEDIHRKGEKINRIQSKVCLLNYVINLFGINSLYDIDFSTGFFKIDN